MAVEAPHNHMNLIPPQLLTAREMTTTNKAQMDGGGGGGMALASTVLPSDSGLTYHIPLPRKRSRDRDSQSNAPPLPQKPKLSSQPSIFDHLHSHQYEIDRFIAQHTEKVRMELEEQRVRHSRMLVTAIQEAVAKKLKEKDEEIHRVGNLNWVLQERVKSLCVENQIWRELAQTNEATANSLRNNLEQVLAHVSQEHHHDDDAESSCGSNVHREGGGGGNDKRMCNRCGVRESIVLLLPCRHLCLCTMCGSTLHTCPLCHSGINASVHVNYS
uniref:RING-type domain-containing protein n=2 Tax=Cajanus cajan TaxID=3821 RepID=A0A151R859_CAJCA|nr:hypothetical protein KK1_039923 [Cajanus cajan]